MRTIHPIYHKTFQTFNAGESFIALCTGERVMFGQETGCYTHIDRQVTCPACRTIIKASVEPQTTPNTPTLTGKEHQAFPNGRWTVKPKLTE